MTSPAESDTPRTGLSPRRRIAALVAIGLVATGVLAVLAVPRLRPSLLSSDLKLFVDQADGRTPAAGRYATITGRTSRAAKVELFVYGTRIAVTTTSGPEHRFRFDAAFGAGDLVVVRATRYGDRAEVFLPNLKSDPPVKPRFIGAPAVVNREQVVLMGRARPNDRVVIAGPGIRQQDLMADMYGIFEAKVVFPRPGRYELTVKTFYVDESGEAAPPLTIQYDPASTLTYPDPIARHLSIRAARAGGGIEIMVTLARIDERARQLLAGEMPLSSFVHAVFGDVGFITDRFPSPGLLLHFMFLAGARSEIKIVDAHVVVRARSDPQVMTFLLPPWKGSLSLRLGSQFGLGTLGDVVEVHTTGFDLRAMTPSPVSYDSRVARWEGHPLAPIPVISFSLASPPLGSREGILNLLRVPLDVLVPWWLRPLLNVVAMVAPIAAVLALALALGESRAGYMRPFLVLALLGPLIALSFGLDAVAERVLSDQLDRLWDRIGNWSVVTLALAILIVAIAGRALVRFAPRRWAAATERLLTATRIAAALALGVHVVDMLLAVVPWPTLRRPVVTSLVLAPVLLWIATRVVPFQGGQQRALTWSAILLAAVSLTYPLDPGILGTTSERFGGPIQRFLSMAQELMLCALAWAVVQCLREADTGEETLRGRLATLIFATYLVGTTRLAFWLPIPFILALWVGQRFVLVPAARRPILDALAPVIVNDRRLVGARSLALAEALQFRDALDKIDRRTISPTDFERRKTEIDAYVAERERNTALVHGLTTQDVVLAIGPRPSHWDNAVVAVKHGALLTLPLLAIFVGAFLSKDAWRTDQFYFLSTLTRIAAFATAWLMAAFFFGYFFGWIRGGSGLTKGVRVALLILVCLLPARLANLGSVDGLVVLLVTSAQTFFFFAILGVWAFDYRTSREISGGHFDWRTFTRLGDMRTIAASVSVVITAIGLAGTSVLTNQFTTVLSLLVRMAFPQVELPKTGGGPSP